MLPSMARNEKLSRGVVGLEETWFQGGRYLTAYCPDASRGMTEAMPAGEPSARYSVPRDGREDILMVMYEFGVRLEQAMEQNDCSSRS